MADAKSIIALISIVYIWSHRVVEAKHVLEEYKGTVKTIVSEEDVIDCVDFYKQPAFDDPLIKNNTEMMPSSYPRGVQLNSSQPELPLPWHKHGECPKGTIPIRRTSRHHNHKAFQFHSHELEPDPSSPGTKKHEYAAVAMYDGEFYGASALINVWNPKTEVKGFSLSQIWISANDGPPQDKNTIEAGWIVYHKLNGDSRTRFFIYWTRDNYGSSGCYNLLCAGFVQTSRSFALGSTLWPVSTYGDSTYEISLSIYQDPGNRNWWLEVQGAQIGYWPNTLFTGLRRSASSLSWGGEVFDPNAGGGHTTTQMGSGHFSPEGFKKSSFFRNLHGVDIFGGQIDPVNLEELVTNPECYDLQVKRSDEPWGIHFYYGGPGFSDKCP